MKNNLSAAVVGLLFSLGLGISGMTRPEKIFGFLDVMGSWDPTLLFVMFGAIAIHFAAFRLITKRPHPLFADKWRIPDNRTITKSLAAGSILFGAGWALAGYCPGPAITSLGTLAPRPLLFVLGMGVGMMIFRLLDHKLKFRR